VSLIIPAGAGPLAKGGAKAVKFVNKGEKVVKGVDKAAEGVKDTEKVAQGLQRQTHHILTNKNDKWTFGFKKLLRNIIWI
jgi:hypothetical protein